MCYLFREGVGGDSVETAAEAKKEILTVRQQEEKSMQW